jgi:membrane AbrB-like protein
MTRLLLLLAAGTLGAWVARRFKTPGGPLLAAMLAAALVSFSIGEVTHLPEWPRWLALLLLGTYTGSTVDRDTLRRIASALPVLLLLVGVLLAAGLGLGLLVHARAGGGVSPVTVMMGTMPGGASGLSAVAFDLGADPRLVASMHSARMLLVFGAMPLLLRWMVGAGSGGNQE